MDAESNLLDRYWRAANYLTVGQIYLQDNPLLREPLTAGAHQAPTARPLGHVAGPEPHVRAPESPDPRARRQRDLYRRTGTRRTRGRSPTCIWRARTRRSIPTFTEIARHAAPLPPVLDARRRAEPRERADAGIDPRRRRARLRAVHAFGAAFDNPDLIVACVVGDGEAETAPLAGSWKGIDFLNPVRDGAVLPILHLNGYKIAGPTVLARDRRGRRLRSCAGARLRPCIVRGSDPTACTTTGGGSRRVLRRGSGRSRTTRARAA